MNKNFIKMLCESEIQSTELGLAVENISDQLQQILEKITNIRTKDLSALVKKIKYDNDIEKAQSFEDSIGGKLDQLIQTITEIKGEMDNDVVALFNNENPESNMDNENEEEFSDIDNDFGDESSEEEPSEENNEDEDELDFDFNFDEVGREEK